MCRIFILFNFYVEFGFFVRYGCIEDKRVLNGFCFVVWYLRIGDFVVMYLGCIEDDFRVGVVSRFRRGGRSYLMGNSVY